MSQPACASAPDNIKTLPARLYHDPESHAREMKEVFFKEWLLFCHEALLPAPGHYVAYTIAGRPVMVIRGKDGGLNAFHNVCRHRASQVLKEGTGQTATLRCMYHGWVYDTAGKLCKAPGFGGDEQSLCERTSLFPLHVRTWNKLVFISMAETAPDFEEALGDLPAAMKDVDIASFHSFDMATHQLNCNWKTYIENWLEGYHIPIVHPAFNKEIDFSSYRAIPGRRMVRHQTELKKPEDASCTGLWAWLWPHAILNIYGNSINLELVIPTGPETTELRYCYLFKDASPAKEAENRRAVDMSRLLTQEDIDICEIVQKNLRAGIYERGELSPRHEGGVALFQELAGRVHK